MVNRALLQSALGQSSVALTLARRAESIAAGLYNKNFRLYGLVVLAQFLLSDDVNEAVDTATRAITLSKEAAAGYISDATCIIPSAYELQHCALGVRICALFSMDDVHTALCTQEEQRQLVYRKVRRA